MASMILFAPVPPLATATTPVTLTALPGMLPNTLVALTVAILASVTLPSVIFDVVIALSKIFALVTALFAIAGAAAVPVRSPAS